MHEAAPNRHDAASLTGIACPARLGLLAGLGLLVLGCSVDAAARPASTPSRDNRTIERLVPAPDVPGDPTEGRRLFVSTGCGGCHTVRGVPAATGVSGPNLTNVVLRPTLAGETLAMSPETLAGFLLDPAGIKPGSPMLNVGLTSEQALHITAFLYSQPHNRSP
jgi:cytochrome c oxidase subunit 2